ncbi:uncharacterized protein LOC131148431 [Malania oleifera]|uniref:uncharacterized protein LOC131148431 n=1 Tax=Malania oleifera TaxID=397392 RepID=UPI0025AEBEF3|nr:uncharacterized protein LOC131148431 [Malania oleifera]
MVVHKEEEAIVQTYSEAQQNRHLDSLNQNLEEVLPTRVRLDTRTNILKELKKTWISWTIERHLEFSKLYGHIGFLLHVGVNFDVITVLVEFWNPYYHCFTLEGVDMAPTMEEYVSLLHLPKTYESYKPNTATSFRKELCKVLGFKAQRVNAHVGKEDKTISWENLTTMVNRDEVEKSHMSMLALAIYGLVIFPKEMGVIDHGTVSFLAQIQGGVNPVPSILAETFRSLHHCRIKGKGRLKCCAPLLYVWFMSYVPCKESYFHPIYSSLRIPLTDFKKASREEYPSKEEWADRMRNWETKGFSWLAPWMGNSDMVYRCGDFPWVPLLGPWGGIAYAPLMFKRQVGSCQFIPMTHGLSKSEITYEQEEDHKRMRKFVAAWKIVHVIGLGKRLTEVRGNYYKWVADRMGLQVVGISNPLQAPMNQMEERIREVEVITKKAKDRERQIIRKYQKNVKRRRDKCIQVEEEIFALRKRLQVETQINKACTRG